MLDFLLDDFSSWTNPTAITLTCKHVAIVRNDLVVADPARCEQNLRHFLNLLKREAYGNRRKKPVLPCIPIREQSGNERYHHHLLIDRPETISAFRLQRETVPRLWRRTHFGDKQINVQLDANEGWVDYMCKLRTKSDYIDAFDLGNLRLKNPC